MQITVNFHMRVDVSSCHSSFEIHRVLTEQLFSARKAIETLAESTLKVYGLPSDSPQTFIIPSAKVAVA